MNQNFHVKTKLTETGETVLHICAQHNMVDLFDWFVYEYHATVFVVNDFGETPLMIAAREGRMDIVRLYKREYMHKFGFKID